MDTRPEWYHDALTDFPMPRCVCVFPVSLHCWLYSLWPSSCVPKHFAPSVSRRTGPHLALNDVQHQTQRIAPQTAQCLLDHELIGSEPGTFCSMHSLAGGWLALDPRCKALPVSDAAGKLPYQSAVGHRGFALHGQKALRSILGLAMRGILAQHHHLIFCSRE
jgi:hypothetical protein